MRAVGSRPRAGVCCCSCAMFAVDGGLNTCSDWNASSSPFAVRSWCEIRRALQLEPKRKAMARSDPGLADELARVPRRLRLAKRKRVGLSALDVVPRQWFVTEHVREKCSCRSCEKISEPPAPFHAIARGFAGTEPAGEFDPGRQICQSPAAQSPERSVCTQGYRTLRLHDGRSCHPCAATLDASFMS